MKKLLGLFAFLLLVGVAQAQNAGDAGSNSSATVNYNVGDLEKLDKLQLTTIYIAKLNRLYSILPYIPFEKLEPKSANDLKIPTNSLNDKSLQSLNTNLDALGKTLDTTMTNLGPYADKNNLIYSILFLQSIINKVELVGLGMNSMGFSK